MAHCNLKSNGLPARASAAAVGITHDQVTSITGGDGEGKSCWLRGAPVSLV